MRNQNLFVFGANSRLAQAFLAGADLKCYSRIILIGTSSSPSFNGKFIGVIECIHLPIHVTQVSNCIDDSKESHVIYIDGASRGLYSKDIINFYDSRVENLLNFFNSFQNITRLIIVGSIESVTPKFLSLNDSYTELKKNELNCFLLVSNKNKSTNNICYVMFPPLGKSNRILGRIICISYKQAGKILDKLLKNQIHFFAPLLLSPFVICKFLANRVTLHLRFFI